MLFKEIFFSEALKMVSALLYVFLRCGRLKSSQAAVAQGGPVLSKGALLEPLRSWGSSRTPTLRCVLVPGNNRRLYNSKH